MKIKAGKKTIIIGLVIILYVFALPLAIHISGVFYDKAIPDLKRLNGYQTRYLDMSNIEKRELLSEAGFDLMAFENGGFNFNIEDIQVFVYDDESDKIHSIKMQTFKEETYLISLTIYTFEAEQQSVGFLPRYERCDINGKAVGFLKSSDSSDQRHKARYYDEKNDYIYYIEAAFEFNEPEYSFLAILIR